MAGLGIEARGRSTPLRVNYRNTEEVLRVAYHLSCGYVAAAEADEDRVPLIAPESARRHGPEPVVRVLGSFDEEARSVAAGWLLQHPQHAPSRHYGLGDEGLFWSD